MAEGAQPRRRGEDRIPLFTGKPNDSFSMWLKKFKLGAQAMQWTPATQIVQIPTYFTGLAELRWFDIPEATVKNFTMEEPPNPDTDITQYLKTLFLDKGEAQKSTVELLEITQDNRDVSDYLLRFEKLIQKAKASGPIGLEIKKILFVRGLDSKLKKSVEFKKPGSFADAVEWAQYFETLKEESEQVIHETREVNSANQSVPNYRVQPQCFRCWKWGHTQYYCNGYPPDERKNRLSDNNRRRRFREQRERRLLPENWRDERNRYGEFRNEWYSNAERVTPDHRNDQNFRQRLQDEQLEKRGRGMTYSVSEDLLTLGKNVGPNMLTKIRIAGVKTIALIDSGATCSIISESLAEKVPYRVDWAIPATKASSASGHPLSFTKSAKLPIELKEGYPCSQMMHVLRKSPYPCILGTDFMEKMGCMQIDFERKVISLGQNMELPMIEKPKCRQTDQVRPQPQVNLINGKNMVLDPWCQTYLWVKVENGKNGDCMNVDEKSTPNPLKNSGIVVARSIGTVTKGLLPMTILNTSPKPVTLYEGANVGTAEVVEKEIVPLVGSITHAPVSEGKTDPLAKLDLSKSDLNREQKKLLETFLKRNGVLFTGGQTNPGQTSRITHGIDTNGHPPLHSRAHRTPFSQKEKVKKMVEEMVKVGIARPSSSPWASPIVLVKKKSGEDRFCVDYRRLNDITKKDTYPLPKISELLDSLGKSKFFTTLDLNKGYWQIPMKEKDKEKTAFITSEGLFEFNVMPFGLTNAPATFQRGMDIALAGLQGDQCLVYLDDIIIYSETFEHHIQKMAQVFKRLASFGLKLNMKKCHFARKTVLYLGHLISKHGMQPDPEKTEMIKTFPAPRNEKELERFLGLASYYRRFVKGFSSIAEPLDALRRKENKFEWSNSCQNAFDRLKEALMTPPVLAFPDFKKPFLLETDASGTGIGAILSQENWDERNRRKVWKPVAFASRTLSKSERNYHATEREALAIIWGLKKFRVYVYGTPVKLVSDHAPLQWLMTTKNPSGRLSRWAIQLQEYNLIKDDGKIISHKPGKAISHVDACSRMFEVNTFVPTDGALQITEEQKKDDGCKSIMDRLERGEAVPGFMIDRGVLHHIPRLQERDSAQFQTQIVVPLSLRESILKMCHDNLFGGHMGANRTFDRVSLRYFWPSMRGDCERWVETCVFCQKRKGPQKKNKELLVPIPISEPFAKLVVDVLGPLPMTERGNRYIVIFTDHFTKYVEAFAVPNHTAVTIAQLLVSKVICRHGAPCELLSDQGTEFLSKLVKETCMLCDVAKVNSTAYHPQTQGLTERFNRTILGILKGYANQNHTDWDKFIPFALAAYHGSKQKSLGESPFYLVYGRDPRMPSDVAFQAKRSLYIDPEDNYVESTKHRFHLARKLATDALGEAQENMKKQYDKTANISKIRKGQLVSLHKPSVAVGVSPKLWVHWSGPFKVIEIKGPNAMIKSPKQDEPAYWTHLNRLKPFKARYGEPDFETTRNVEENIKKGKGILQEQRVTFGHHLRSGKLYSTSDVRNVLQDSRRISNNDRYFWNQKYGGTRYANSR